MGAKLIQRASELIGVAAVAGNIAGYSGIHKFGQNATIDTNTDPEDIWSYGGLYTTHFMSSAATLYLSSDAAGDTGIEVEVQYLDSNWDVAAVTGTTDATDGRTFVSLEVTGIRVFRAKVTGASEPSGNIYISDDNTDAGGDGIPDTTTHIKAYIAAGDNQTMQAIYTIPAGYTGFLLSYRLSMVSQTSGSSAVIDIEARPFGGVFQVKEREILRVDAPIDIRFCIPEMFTEKTDILLRVASVTNNSTNVTGSFDLLLIKNTALGAAR